MGNSSKAGVPDVCAHRIGGEIRMYVNGFYRHGFLLTPAAATAPTPC